MSPPNVTLAVPPQLQPLAYARRRADRVTVPADGVSTIGHLIGSIGIPRTEVGRLSADGQVVTWDWIPSAGATVQLRVRQRPQPVPTTPISFLLDVHLGTLARRLRLLGLDASWRNDATDPELIERSLQERRVLLTRDRGLLLRRHLPVAAYVRGDLPDDQLADVLDRFAPPLAPWTRCPGCNAVLQPVAKADVVDLIEPGTRRTYDVFSRCPACGRVYWRGAHHARLRRIVESYVAPADPEAPEEKSGRTREPSDSRVKPGL